MVLKSGSRSSIYLDVMFAIPNLLVFKKSKKSTKVNWQKVSRIYRIYKSKIEQVINLKYIIEIVQTSFTNWSFNLTCGSKCFRI